MSSPMVVTHTVPLQSQPTGGCRQRTTAVAMTSRPADLDNKALATLLEWATAAPALLTPPDGVTLFDSLLAPSPPDDALLAHTHRHLAASNDQRLGKLFEEITALAIAHQPGLEIITRNLVVRDAQRTIGELDLLVHDLERDHILHVEVALKFYLGVHADYWPGPNSRDTLARKWRRLANHQFPLIDHPATRHTLAEHGIARIDGQCLFSRGRLFYPDNTGAQSLPAPASSHPGHARGDWLRCQALDRQCRWQVLERPQWLNGRQLSDKSMTPLAAPELIDYVQAKGRPVMAVPECSLAAPPCFIVPDDGWPDP